MKLNKAEKFVKSWVKLGRTRNAIREAIFDKLGTWNFPPEYEDALKTQFPNHEKDLEPILGVDYLNDYVCDICGNCHELCFCGDEEADYWKDQIDHSAKAEQAMFGPSATNHEKEKCFICRGECQCEIIELPKIPELPDPGTEEWERFVDQIREIDTHMPMILHAKKLIEASGRNFDEEFEKWKERRGIK
jgi:hypothetical protein